MEISFRKIAESSKERRDREEKQKKQQKLDQKENRENNFYIIMKSVDSFVYAFVDNSLIGNFKQEFREMKNRDLTDEEADYIHLGGEEHSQKNRKTFRIFFNAEGNEVDMLKNLGFRVNAAGDMVKSLIPQAAQYAYSIDSTPDIRYLMEHGFDLGPNPANNQIRAEVSEKIKAYMEAKRESVELEKKFNEMSGRLSLEKMSPEDFTKLKEEKNKVVDRLSELDKIIVNSPFRRILPDTSSSMKYKNLIIRAGMDKTRLIKKLSDVISTLHIMTDTNKKWEGSHLLTEPQRQKLEQAFGQVYAVRKELQI